MDTLANETWQNGINRTDLDIAGRRRADLTVASLPRADDQARALEGSTTGQTGVTPQADRGPLGDDE